MTSPVQPTLSTEQYIARQAAINWAAIQSLQGFLKFYYGPALSFAKWLQVLEWVFPKVQAWRLESSKLARDYFDGQYSTHLPGEPRHDVLLDHYEYQWFVEAVEPARSKFSRDGATQADADDLVRRIVKEIENAGRKTIVEAVQSLNEEIMEGRRELRSQDEQFSSPEDPDSPPENISTAQLVADTIKQQLAEEAGRPTRQARPKQRVSASQVVGWARVATGRETCAFCLTLVSRGPVYRSAEGAGLNLDDDEALESVLANDPELDKLMTKWHPNCDCKVVPVFNANNWDGRAAFKRAEDIWMEATKGWSGKNALNAFRREIERGNVRVEDFAI